MASAAEPSPSNGTLLSRSPDAESRPEARPERPRVLCVDDAPLMRRMMERVLERQFDVRTVDTAEGAIAQLCADGPYAVIVSDLRLPISDGLRLLKVAYKLRPDTVRVLFSGHVGLSVALDAINDAAVFRILQAPFRDEVLIRTVADAVAHHGRLRDAHAEVHETLSGCVSALLGVLAMARPSVFGRAQRVLRHVRDLARSVNTAHREYLEIAALLADIGALALPPDLVERLYRGATLSDEEQARVQALPRIVDEYLAHMPGLTIVRDILAHVADDHQTVCAGDRLGTAERGRSAGILRIARDFDHLINVGMAAADALELMARRGTYDMEVLVAFKELRGPQDPTAHFVEIPMAEVEVGMIFAEDVIRPDNMLLVARGQAVTTSLRGRITHEWSHFAQTQVIRMLRCPPASVSA